MSRKRSAASRRRELRQRPKDEPATNRCSGCGKPKSKIRCIGMYWGYDMTQIKYSLCPKCTAALKRGGDERQRIATTAEFYLGVDRPAGGMQ